MGINPQRNTQRKHPLAKRMSNQLVPSYLVTKFLKIIKQGDICWDIGANIGFYTYLLASQVEDARSVVAFEPAARTCDYLNKNVSLNQFLNVTVVNKGLCDKIEQ